MGQYGTLETVANKHGTGDLAPRVQNMSDGITFLFLLADFTLS